MTFGVFGLQQNSSIEATTEQTVDVPANARFVYISSDQLLRVSLDVATPASATSGLLTPDNVTSLYAVKGNTILRLFNTGASIANVSMQFLG